MKTIMEHLNPFYVPDPFLYLLKTSENLCFFMFSGVIERDPWHEMVK